MDNKFYGHLLVIKLQEQEKERKTSSYRKYKPWESSINVYWLLQEYKLSGECYKLFQFNIVSTVSEVFILVQNWYSECLCWKGWWTTLIFILNLDMGHCHCNMSTEMWSGIALPLVADMGAILPVFLLVPHCGWVMNSCFMDVCNMQA